MKVSNEHISRLIGARVDRVFRAEKQAPADGVVGTRADGAVFSTRSEDVRAGMVAARAATSPDEGRLAALQAQVRSGQYRPPAEIVAESILRDMGK